MIAAETAEGGEGARGRLRTRWRVALAAVSVTAAVAMTGWALGTPPGGGPHSGVNPSVISEERGTVPVPERPDRTGPPDGS
jgi:hypothetical protein